MTISRSKTATVIAIFLVSTIAITLVALPAANAQVKLITKKTYALIGAMPNPIGVGQETLIHLGITDELQTAAHGWEGLTVTVTKPDGTTETLGPFKTDSTGGTGTIYIPTTVGTYYLQTHFPAQRYNWTLYGGASVWYEASDSSKLALIVQAEPIKYYPGSPLPTEYWTRPIDAQHREWSKIAGNFLEAIRYDSPFVPYSNGPESAHILWAKPLATGGLVGGELGVHSYDHGDAYEGKFQGSVVINGVLYYNRYEPRGGTNIEKEVVAVDLRTGKELWVRNWNNETLAFGQVFQWDSYNLHGAYAFLWTTVGSTWKAYDALTGRWIYTIRNVPSGITKRGLSGELYRLQVDLARGWMALWNSSAIVSMEGSWNPHGNTYDAAANTTSAMRAWAWNVTIPRGLPGSVQATFLFDKIIGANTVTRTAENLISGRINQPIPLWGISLKPGQEGNLLFNTTWTPPQTDLFISFGDAGSEEGVFTMWSKETRQHYGFDINTGKYLWTTEPQHYWDTYGIRINLRLGKLYATGFAGIVYAYDVKTGKTLWNYDAVDPYNELKEGRTGGWALLFAFYTGDNKIFLFPMEHSPATPLARGAPSIMLNAETGEEIWKLNLRGTRWGGHNVIGDGIIAMHNSYDNRIYAIGKGPTATTVTAPDTAQPLGTPVLIKGMVTDISPGTEDYALKARFPHGVPAVSDASMSEWMKYVYMQFPRPMDAVGVDVVISVLDPNNNFYEVGKTTSDASGFFSNVFTPLVPGEYTVIASFAGSKAYYSSFAETAIYIQEAPQATPAPTPPPATVADLYLVPGIAGIIIAIAVVGALLMLMLRKR